jgi:tRNA (adenine37-N6)-methyltransferase
LGKANNELELAQVFQLEWQGLKMWQFMIQMIPIGQVRNTHVNVVDDRWGGIESRIVLSDSFGPEAFAGLQEFSHAEIIYYFHEANPAGIVRGARHPRDNPRWPKIGIFAQRGRNRPNLIGSTVVRILGCEGTTLRVAELDAVDGTPVLDIKPVMAEFLPRSALVQPEWSREVMQNYWDRPSE